MRGAVSAGMGVVLEAAGLTGAFDRIYGASAGALNGCALAVGQAALSATQCQDAASRGVINRMRPLMGRSVIDFELLFEQLIAARKPLSFDGLASGPEFRALATSLETLSLRVLAGFADIGELMRGGAGERIAAQARRRAAHIPGRADGGRRPDRADPGRYSAARGGHPCARAALAIGGIPPAHTAKPRRVVHAARRAETGRAAASPSSGLQPPGRRAPAGVSEDRRGAHELQVAVPNNTRLVGRLEGNTDRVTDALWLGAMASAILREPIDLCWQPVVYRARPSQSAVRQPARAPASIPNARAPVVSREVV